MSRSIYSHRLRKGRYSSEGQVYLITTTTHNRVPVFADWTLGRLVVMQLRAAHERGEVSSLAWVVMPDHMHWLFALRSGSLTGVMQKVKSRSGLAVNRALGGSGRIWQDGYNDKAVRRDEDILILARYIVANPVRARLVGRVGDYPLWDAIWI